MTLNLQGRKFRPVENSADGAVSGGTIFTFSQTDRMFTAEYSGAGIKDGHVIGKMTSDTHADLLYHCRTDTGQLAAGHAKATFSHDDNGAVQIDMAWQWLNGSQTSGTSRYKEIIS